MCKTHNVLGGIVVYSALALDNHPDPNVRFPVSVIGRLKSFRQSHRRESQGQLV